MPVFARKKVYTNRYIREMTIEQRALASVAQITIIMIKLVVPIIWSTMPVGWMGQITMQIWS